MYYPKQIPYLLDKEFKENIEYIKNDAQNYIDNYVDGLMEKST